MNMPLSKIFYFTTIHFKVKYLFGQVSLLLLTEKNIFDIPQKSFSYLRI